MLIRDLEVNTVYIVCNSCNKEKAEITMHGYAEDTANIQLCPGCSMQLARKLLEDLCAFDTPGGRHG